MMENSRRYKVLRIIVYTSKYGYFNLPRPMWVYIPMVGRLSEEDVLRQIWNEFGNDIKEYLIYQLMETLGVIEDGDGE